MGLYRRNRIFWLTFTHREERHSVSSKEAPGGPFTDRKLAEAWADGYRERIRRDEVEKDCPISHVLGRYIELHLSPKNPSAAQNAKNILAKFVNYVETQTLTSAILPRLAEYKAWRLKTPRSKGSKCLISPATVRRQLSIIKAATAKAVEWGMISKDPLEHYKLDPENNERIRYIEDAEFWRLVNATHPAFSPIIIMARYTGMRQGEILGLQWSNVDLKRGFALLPKTKSGRSREVPLSTEVINLLSKTPLSERVGLVFKLPNSGRRDGWVRFHFLRAVRLAGLVDFHFHDLRHTWASHAAMKGGDVQSIAKVLGHRTLRMTQRYSHFSDAHLKATVELAAPKKPLPTATKLLQNAADGPGEETAIDTGKVKTPPIKEGFHLLQMVPGTGLEPVTPSMSRK